MTSKSMTYLNEAGEEVTEEFPGRKDACLCCEGKGEYRAGYIGILTCERCGGSGVEIFFDEERMDERQREIVEDALRHEWVSAAEIAAERALGC